MPVTNKLATCHDCWVVADNGKTLLFFGAKPEMINNKWTTFFGAIGELPEKQFPPANFKQPVHMYLSEIKQ